MRGGFRGHLITTSFAQDVLLSMPGAAHPSADVRRALERWDERREESFGPATSLRAIADGVVLPLLRILGYELLRRSDDGQDVRFTILARDVPIPLVVVAWNEDLGRAWRAAILAGIATDARWTLCTNGRSLRICDSHRAWSRDYLEFDFNHLGHDPETQSIVWSVLRSASLAQSPSLLDEAVELSARHGSEICRTLADGVLASLRLILGTLRTRTSDETPARLFEQSLTIVYRILFLLFAEARALVPVWHPVYRDRYTIDAIVSTVITGRRYRGAWSAIQAISRLAHAGCAAGELKVTAFNGRLFSPAHAPAFERRRFDDEVIAKAVLAVSTTTRCGGRARIRYRDLDVEQLGAVYEHVLEYQPTGHDIELARSRDTRKASGTFYTPRQVTAHLVRHTLAPLVQGRTAEEILALRIVDPAMGSGAFLVGACRFLAHAVEEALVRDGRWHSADITQADRAAVRRDIAQRCLFGVDLNPIAVQLARLSIWLATLAADKPLTFLDHHLMAGNSLIGAAFEDVARQPGGSSKGHGRPQMLPLFDDEELAASLRVAILDRLTLIRQPDDSAAVVRDKERQLAAIHGPTAPLGRWKRVLDLWCAGWFFSRDAPFDRALFAELTRVLLDDRTVLPGKTTERLLDQVDALAETHRFFHWPVAFPEVFRNDSGDADARRGFDAVVGNPPWDMVRGDSGTGGIRNQRRGEAHDLAAFVREAGIYRIESRSHLNRYALFLERALQLTRPGGRIGLVLPAGVLSDVGTAPLRRHLFDRAAVDTVTGLDNHAGIFPIHRSLRFVLLTCTTGEPTEQVTCRFGISHPDDLDSDAPSREQGSTLHIPRAFLERVSGADDLGVPELLSKRDLRILERITATTPCAGDADGWHLHFGRELNASDDRDALVPFTGDRSVRPVLEGKQIEPFRTSIERSRYQLRPGVDSSAPRRPRLAYRDVASATNRLTLIAAVIPARAITTHTLFCLKTALPLDAQHVVCALFNSFVANYLVRLRVSTHVTTALVAKLRLPVVVTGSAPFDRLSRLSRNLASASDPCEQMEDYAELQALAAKLYGLRREDFRHILGTFPLIAIETRQAALARFDSLRS
jgi:hypothetical protein